jgi:hypothetical protein
MQKALCCHYHFNRLIHLKRFRRIAQPTAGLSAQPSNESDTSAPSTACSSIAVRQVVELEPFELSRSHREAITKSSKKSSKISSKTSSKSFVCQLIVLAPSRSREPSLVSRRRTPRLRRRSLGQPLEILEVLSLSPSPSPSLLQRSS